MPRRYLSFAFLLALGVLIVLRPSGDADALDPRLETAIALYRTEGAEKALPVFVRLAKEFADARQRRDEMTAIHYIGESHWRLGNFDDSRSELDLALSMERKSGNRLAEGKTLNVRGLLEWDLGNYDAAMKDFQAAGTIGHNVGDKKLEGSSLNNLSLVYDELGRYDVSLAQYKRVLALYREADFPRGEGDTLGNIGGVHLLLGRFREALPYYEQALAISEKLKSKPSISQDHGNIALCLVGLGEIDEAIDHFNQAIELARQTGMQQDEAYWLMGKANGVMQKGRYDQGLEYHRASLTIYEKIGAQAELLEALHDMGRLHLLLGDPDSAERDFRRALDLAKEIGLPRGITQNLLALGDLQYRAERLDAAGALYEEARQRAEDAKEQHRLAESDLRLALVHRDQGKNNEASTEIDRALDSARDIDARALEAEALVARSDLDRRQGRNDEALAGFNEAEKLLAQIGDPELLWQIYYGQALTFEAKNNIKAAIDALTAAVRLIEGVRNRLQEQRFRAGYVEDKYEVYIELVRLQLGQGLTAEAFSTAERLRARSYAEQLGGRSTSSLSKQDRQRETELRERIRQLQRSLTEEDNEGQPIHRQEALGTFSRELLVAEQEYQSFLDDRGAGRSAPASRGGMPSASDIQARLDDNEAVVEYVVGRERLMIFVLTSHGVAARMTPVRRVDLDSRIALLRDLTRRPGTDRWLKPAASLSAALLQPIEKDGLLEGVEHLYIVPHGVLNYLPFALLPIRGAADGPEAGGLLLDRFTLAQLPAAAVLLNDGQVRSGPASMLAVAPARSRLRFAPEEAKSIDALFKPHSRLLIGDGATESEFKRLAGDYRVLHLATHGSFNNLNPLLSGLELEADNLDDGLLQVHEVLDLRLSADLVTLSACDTALGSGYFTEVPAGDDFVGMTRAFLSAGSESVLATLWEVDDQASVRLMHRFYARINSAVAPRGVAAALARAQRELHASSALHHPYYWAPFVLVGTETRIGPAKAQVAEKST
jgi:CHAT domain-containing protein/Tfp pilus assembly protein PilF